MPVSATSVFDYIVVGAGTAGCVLAARLAEDPQLNILLMEAGVPGNDRLTQTPLAFPGLFRSERDWAFWTEPQPELRDRRLFWPRGKMLGGSGSMNAMVHMDPCREDLDAWDAAGCHGWSFQELRPLLDAMDSQPLDPHPLQELNPLSQAFLEACQGAGLPEAPYLRDAGSEACGPFRVNTRQGRRWGAREAYLEPALERGNLTVWTRTHVARVLFEGDRAIGIAYEHEGRIGQVAASREILLCAGTVGSPHLLMLSGIGPEAHLHEFGIPVQAGLEGVGANLQDHLAAPVSMFSTQPISFSGANTRRNRMRFRLRHKGPLSSNGAEAGAVLRSSDMESTEQSKSNTASDEACDLELLFAPVHFVDHGFARPGGHGFSVIPILLNPHSRGTVRLWTPDYREAPLIDPRYLSDRTGGDQLEACGGETEHVHLREEPRSVDLERLVRGVEKARQVIGHKAFEPYRGIPVAGKPEPPVDHVRTWGQTLYHPVGTCRMGVMRVAGPDAGPVVNSALQVYGVVGLRVVDASVIPQIPRAHTNVLVIAIAERAAQMILGK